MKKIYKSNFIISFFILYVFFYSPRNIKLMWGVMNMKEFIRSFDNTYLKMYVKGLIQSFILALIMILILTLVFFFIDLNSNLIRPLEFVILLLSVLYGSIFISRKVDNKGWLHGIIMGTVYFLVFFLINMVVSFEGFNMLGALPKWIFFASTGFIGGCIGINLK